MNLNITGLKRITDHNGDFPLFLVSFDHGKRFCGDFVLQLLDGEFEIKSKYHHGSDTKNITFLVNGVTDVELCIYYNYTTKERRLQNYPEVWDRPKPWVEHRGFLPNPVPNGATSILRKNFICDTGELVDGLIKLVGPEVMAESALCDATRNWERANRDMQDKQKEFLTARDLATVQKREIGKAQTKLRKIKKVEPSLVSQLGTPKLLKKLSQ